MMPISGLNRRLPSCSTCHRRLRNDCASAIFFTLAGIPHLRLATADTDCAGRRSAQPKNYPPVPLYTASKWFCGPDSRASTGPMPAPVRVENDLNHRAPAVVLNLARVASLMLPIASLRCARYHIPAVPAPSDGANFRHPPLWWRSNG